MAFQCWVGVSRGKAVIAALSICFGALAWLTAPARSSWGSSPKVLAHRQEPQDAPLIPDLSQVEMPELVAALESDEPSRRLAALRELGSRGAASFTAAEAIAKALTDDSVPAVRGEAARALPRMGLPADQVLNWLDKAIRDDGLDLSGAPIWVIAAEAMGTYGDKALSRVEKLLSENETHSTRAATAALGKMPPESVKAVVPRLLEELARDDDETRLFAISALGGGSAAADQVVPALVRTLTHRDFHSQYWACMSLGRLGPAGRSAVGDLIRALREGPASVRRHAALALGQIGSEGPEAVAALTEAIKDPVQPVRRDALISLAKLGRQSLPAVDVLQNLLDDQNFNCRSYAALAVYRITGKKDRPLAVLIEELRGTNSGESVEVLTEIGPEIGAVAELRKVLKSTDLTVRYFGMEALGELGKAATDALPDLQRIADDAKEDPEIRQVARESIEAIRTENPRTKSARDNL